MEWKKTKYMVIRTGDKKEEEIKESVEIGQMKRTHQYKYMGLILNEKGTVDGKMIGITNSIKKIGSEINVGVEEVRVRLQLYEPYLVPSLLYALDGWANIA